MFNKKGKKGKGQSTLEYALIIAIVVAGLLMMQHYVKRGLAGRYRASSDDLGEQFAAQSYHSNFHISQYSHVNQVLENRRTSTTHLSDQVSNKTGEEGFGNYNSQGLYDNW